MLEAALAAHLPLIHTTTDDPINAGLVLQHMSGQHVTELVARPKVITPDRLFYSFADDWVNTEVVRQMATSGATLVLVNTEPTALAFDGGPMHLPDALLRERLRAFLTPQQVEDLTPILRGLSLKMAREVLALTEVRTGHLHPSEVRRTRSLLAPAAHGLSLLDNSLDFYDWPQELRAWVRQVTPYFHRAAHPRLVPRGVLLHGVAGTGKTTASKAIASALNVPLYRLDIAGTLDRYVGVSESRLAQALSAVDRESPCVLLIDEVEKLFANSGEDSSGVTGRMLSQLLWWLAEHQSRVLTVLTTNNLDALPPELSREGRIDRKFQLPKMETGAAVEFAKSVLATAIQPTEEQYVILTNALRHHFGPLVTHAEATEATYSLIRARGWGLVEE